MCHRHRHPNDNGAFELIEGHRSEASGRHLDRATAGMTCSPLSSADNSTTQTPSNRNLNLGHKAVATAPHILDGVLMRTIVADRAANLFDTRRQVRLGDEPMPPHPIEQFNLRQHSIAVLDQSRQEINRLRFEMNRPPATEQLPARPIELDVTEPDHRGILAVLPVTLRNTPLTKSPSCGLFVTDQLFVKK
jgi:hypothetical protein